MKKIKLCNRGGCCPTVEETEYGYIIQTDNGSEVILTKEQMEILKREVK